MLKAKTSTLDERTRRPSVLRVLLLLAMVFALASPAAWAEEGGQSKRPSQQERQPSIKTGDKCERRTDAIPGVVKRDGCGRWYCGRADVKDITEVVPNIEEVAHCKWQLQGSRCVCAKTGAPR